MHVALQRLSALRPAIILAAVVLVSTIACKDDVPRRGARLPPASREDSTTYELMESAGEIVIAHPKGQYVGGPLQTTGSVTGSITLTTQLTPSAPTFAGRDTGVCGTSVPDSSVERKGSGLGNVVVWLDDVRKGKTIPLEKRLELESDHCLLTPRVQGAVVGSAVNVIGHDDFRQHLQFFAAGEDAPRARVLMGKDEQVIPTELVAKIPGLVLVRDADHHWPVAYVAVFDHPYYAVTKADGSFTIDAVPAGTYTLMAWHERTGKTQQKVTVASGRTARVSVGVTGK